MSRTAQPEPDSPRSLAGAAWRFRWQVECEAEIRFGRLAGRLRAHGSPSVLIDLARQASLDEHRHARHCARLAAALGCPVPSRPPPAPPPVAPPWLEEPEAVTYELTAASCVAETVSVAVLTRLLAGVGRGPLHAVLHELARDEVAHARLGWAHLTLAADRGRAAFLGAHLPAMLAGSVEEDTFLGAPPAQEDPGLLRLGVLPHAERRALFVRALETVIFPGLEGAGVETGAARRWLAGRLAAEAGAPLT